MCLVVSVRLQGGLELLDDSFPVQLNLGDDKALGEVRILLGEGVPELL